MHLNGSALVCGMFTVEQEHLHDSQELQQRTHKAFYALDKHNTSGPEQAVCCLLLHLQCTN